MEKLKTDEELDKIVDRLREYETEFKIKYGEDFGCPCYNRTHYIGMVDEISAYRMNIIIDEVDKKYLPKDKQKILGKEIASFKKDIKDIEKEEKELNEKYYNVEPSSKRMMLKLFDAVKLSESLTGNRRFVNDAVNKFANHESSTEMKERTYGIILYIYMLRVVTALDEPSEQHIKDLLEIEHDYDSIVRRIKNRILEERQEAERKKEEAKAQLEKNKKDINNRGKQFKEDLNKLADKYPSVDNPSDEYFEDAKKLVEKYQFLEKICTPSAVEDAYDQKIHEIDNSIRN